MQAPVTPGRYGNVEQGGGALMEQAKRQLPRRNAAVGIALVSGLLLLTGCQGAERVTKAGAQAPPITLRMGTDDQPGRPAADQIDQFAREVAARSDGRLRIEPVWQAAGDTGDDDWDQKVARLVVLGELDLGNIPARAWDTEGVTSLRALNAPLLVTSDAKVERIVTSELAATMLTGLDAVGVEGLALLPEGMRRVFWYDEPEPSVDMFHGAFLRVPASATTYATFEALGARADDATAASSADADGAETSFQGVRNLRRGPTSTTVGNLVLWPKVNSLVANRDRMRGLSADLQVVLRDAAAATRTWAIDTVPKDADAARAFCEAGGRVVLVDDAEVEMFRRATAPVVDELEHDATTRDLIAAIEALKPDASNDAAVAGCAGAASEGSAGGPAGTGDGVFPNGTFRAQITAEALLAAGNSREDTRYHAGMWTLTFQDGKVRIDDVNDATRRQQTVEGVYCVQADRISLGIVEEAAPAGRDQCGGFWSARWLAEGDQLRFSEVRGPELSEAALVGTLFGSTPFVRVE